jgi:hypothetical protein
MKQKTKSIYRGTPNKRIFIICCLVLLTAIAAGCSPSDLPSGAFPKQAGSFKLVDGPISRPEHKESNTPKTYYSEYNSASGASLAHSIEVYGSADEAKKAFAEYKEGKEQGVLPDQTFKESGNKLIFTRGGEGGMMQIKWVCGSGFCDVASRDHEAAQQLADSLPYK